MRNRFWQSTGLTALVASVLIGGCGSDAGDTELRVDVPGTPGSDDNGGSNADGPGSPVELGLWRGHWDGKRLTFTPIDSTAATSSVRPQGFVALNDAKLDIYTEEALVFNSSCPEWESPDDYYFVDPENAPYLIGGRECPDHHLCARVAIENKTQRDIDSVFVQVTSISPAGFYADGPKASVPFGYPLDDTLGLWSYDDLPGGIGGNKVDWQFYLPTCEDFTFVVKVMGTLKRSSYTVSGSVVAESDWVDACTLDNATKVLQNAAPGSHTSITAPFPFTLYDKTFDGRTGSTPLTISANGALGANAATTDNIQFPGSNTYMIYPFWDELQLRSDGVCYAEVGTAPHRKLVFTWKNADISSTSSVDENMTFSAILNEGSDVIEFVYYRWSNNQTDCTSGIGPTLGEGASIGVARSGSNFAQISHNTERLQDRGAECIPYRYTFTPSPGDQL